MVKSAQSTLIDLVCWCLAHLSSHIISQVWRLKLMKSHFLYIPSTRPGGVVVGVGLRHWWMSHVHWWRRRSQGAPASHHCGGGSRGHRRGTDAAWWGVHGVLVEPQRLSVVMGSNKTSPLSCSRHQSGINISKWNVFGRFWNIINPPKKIWITLWLVVLTILKIITQWEGLSHILWKIQVMFETTNQLWNIFEGIAQPPKIPKAPRFAASASPKCSYLSASEVTMFFSITR